MKGWGRPLGMALLWLAQWAGYIALAGSGMARSSAFALCAGAAMMTLARKKASPMQKALLVAGFPASFVALLLAHQWSTPGWVWLAALVAGAAVFPRLSREDAPLWFSPAGAARELASWLALPAGAVIVDAGSGMGHALRALKKAYPHARVQGVESSAALCWLSRWSAPGCEVARADLWESSWSQADLVYLFLRPEAMSRALEKARKELKPEAWLVSLEFALGAPARRVGKESGGKTLYLYKASDLQEREEDPPESPAGALASFEVESALALPGL